MSDNNEQEAADLAAMNEGDNNLFEVVYRGGGLSDSDIYPIPADVFIRLRIDSSVTEIDEDACYECTILREVVFHNNVITIGRDAFRGCRNLERIELPAGLLRLEHAAFSDCTSLQQIVIPATVHHFGSCIFEDCSSLESVVFVPRTTSIEFGYGMFRGCSVLRFVTLPPDLRSIQFECFRDCTSLTHFHIPESVEEIEARAFCGSGVRSITIPENVQQIRLGAFEDCVFLERVTIHSSNNLTMADNIFANCPLLSVIQMYPWLWPTLFASMNEHHPEFIFRFIRHYSTQILDFEIPDVRLFRRLRRRLRRDGLR